MYSFQLSQGIPHSRGPFGLQASFTVSFGIISCHAIQKDKPCLIGVHLLYIAVNVFSVFYNP
jgi:hypothetical protein